MHRTWHLSSGRIILTVTGMRRRHGQAAGQTGCQGGRAGRGALPEPAPRAGDATRSSWPATSSTPATRSRSSTRWCGRSRPAAPRSPRPPRRSGTPGPPTTRRPRRWSPRGWKDWCRPGPGRAAPTSSPRQILAWAEEQLAAGPGAAPGAAGRPDRGVLRRARAPPLGRASAGPPPGAPLQKPLTCPPARKRKEEHPSLSLLPSPGQRLLTRAPARMPARSPPPAAGWMPATSNCAMPPCTHARRRSRSGSAC